LDSERCLKFEMVADLETMDIRDLFDEPPPSNLKSTLFASHHVVAPVHRVIGPVVD